MAAFDLDGYAAGQRLLDDIQRRKVRTAEAAEVIARLAELSPLEYDRQRDEAAKQLKVRLSTLDSEVERVREANRSSKASFLDDVEPWAQAVNGADLLDELRSIAQRFLILPPRDGESVVALWALFTYCIEVAETAPLLALLSPEKRCGKTTAIALLSRLVRRPLAASNITAAALFRCVEAWTPTLLIDEADSFLGASDETRGVLNSGHTRATAFVVRNVGDDHEPRQFSTWGAKLIAMIGKLPDTLHDRSIVLEMRRKLPSETCEKLRYVDAHVFEVVRRKCARWARDNAHRIRGARPQVPEALDDRAADNWEPLLAIADIAGGRWPRLSREIAPEYSGSGASELSDSVGAELLRNLKAVLQSRPDVDRFGSKELCEALVAEPEWRWATYNYKDPKDKGITQRQLSSLLRPFGIRSTKVRFAGGPLQGYLVQGFEDTFSRYITPSEAEQRNNQGESTSYGIFSSGTGSPRSGSKSDANSLNDRGCSGVPARTPVSGEHTTTSGRCVRCDGEGCGWCR